MAEETRAPRKDLIIANGIDAATGQYALPPLTPADMKEGIVTGRVKDPESKALKSWLQRRREQKFTLQEGLDPRKLDEAGWGVVFPVNTDPAVIEALRPLIEHRRAQAGERCKVYNDNAKGAVRPPDADSKGAWLGRQGAENYGPVDPLKVPYYLLLVGSPEQIDYRFQYQLDVQYAVGRIHFDTPDAYARYAEAVVAAETKPVRRRRKLTFFGPANPGDGATELSSQYLIQPLAEYTTGLKPPNANAWDVETIAREGAVKSRLTGLLAGGENPGLLFTASHGMAFPMQDPLQQARQGALLCQDWPGPSWRKAIPEDFYFSADDLPSTANLAGLIAFFFACYGAGTPQYDEFYRTAFKDRGPIAERSFVAGLPRRMLEQGALAVIGHVERAWGYSFVAGEGLSLNAFRSALHALMSGAPIGYAFEYFNERYAEFTTDLTDKIQREDWDPVDAVDLASSWTATNDAKNYVVLGDPAARVLVLDEPGQTAETLPELRSAAGGTAASGTSADGTTAGGSIPHDEAVAADAAQAPEAEENESPPAAEEIHEEAIVSDAADAAPEEGTPPTVSEVDYGLGEDFAKLRGSLGTTLTQFSQKLGAFLNTALDHAVNLKVTTLTAPDMSKVTVTGSQVSGAAVRAVTVVRLDGDVLQVVPLNEDGEPDAALWAMHLEMVRQAQASRSELLQAAVSSLNSLISLGGPK